jgi:hypothetical protein
MGSITENGELFTEFCCENNLVIGGSIFKHKDCHKYTWTHHNTRNGHQLDHICISGTWRGSLLDVKNKRSADIQSDHELLIAEVRLKISRVQQKSTSAARKFDVSRLQDREVKRTFVDRLKSLNLAQRIDHNDINGSWTHIRDGITQVSEQILGFQPPHKDEWITEQTWKMIELRKTVKNAVDDIGRNLYRELSKACTTALRRDYRRQIEDLARDAESAANLRDMKRL